MSRNILGFNTIAERKIAFPTEEGNWIAATLFLCPRPKLRTNNFILTAPYA